jgi:hypothetical protein
VGATRNVRKKAPHRVGAAKAAINGDMLQAVRRLFKAAARRFDTHLLDKLSWGHAYLTSKHPCEVPWAHCYSTRQGEHGKVSF